MRVLVHIPARAGSKGIPGKNLRTVGGLSLVAWAVRAGQTFLRAQGLEGFVLVDTDGADIAAEAARALAPAPFLRSAALSTDGALTIDATLAALERLGGHFDAVMLLQPTSPLRTLDDLQACYAAHFETGSALTLSSPPHAPQRALTLDASGILSPLWPAELSQLPRQQLQPTVEPNGAVYVCSVEFLRTHRAFLVSGKTRGVPMPAERSVDIDAEADLQISNALLAARPTTSVSIGGYVIGPGAQCLLVGPDGNAGALKLSRPRDAAEAASLGPVAGLVVACKQLELVAALAQRGVPLLLAVEDASALEVALALDVAAQNSNPPVVILSSRSTEMLSSLGVPVGFTTTSNDIALAIAAVARGACIVVSSCESAELAQKVRGVLQ